MNALQRAVPIPQHEVGMRGALRWQILRQRLPLTARREHIEDRIQNFADVHLAPTPTALGRRYRRFDQRPLAVAQITRVAQAVAVGSTAMFRLPHSAPLSSDAGAREGITTDSSDSTTFWIGSKMIKDTVQGAQTLTLITLGMRDFYSKKEIHNLADLKGLKVRVQATPTDDTLFSAYGAQVVHMPFGEVYSSLQTGVVDVAENGVNVYLSNKHYEVAPVMSMSEHEANDNCIWVSDQAWNSFSDDEKKWVQAAADEVNKLEPTRAIELEHESAAKLEKMGVKLVTDVDKSVFLKAAEPIQDKTAAALGPHAVELLKLVRE